METMKAFFRKNRIKKYVTTALLGIPIGAVLAFIMRKSLKSDTGLYGPLLLICMKYGGTYGNEFFLYVLRKRAEELFVFFMIAALPGCEHILLFLHGMCGAGAGILLSIAVMQYGLKGLWLFAVSLFPQGVFYGAGFLLLTMSVTAGRLGKARFMGILAGLVPVFTGCLTEGYVNPHIITKLLQHF